MSASLSRTDKRADERGITLQTLIITAVLVLMAVVAGVVIVALTGSSSDDLEESGSELEGRCSSVEIFDPEVAARGEKGENYAKVRDFHGDVVVGTFQSERIGCIPVCLWVNSIAIDPEHLLSNPGLVRPEHLRLDPGEVKFQRDRYDGVVYISNPPIPPGGVMFLFSGDRGEIAFYSDSVPEKGLIKSGATIRPGMYSMHPEIDRVAVAPNQNECHTYDADGNVLLG